MLKRSIKEYKVSSEVDFFEGEQLTVPAIAVVR